MRPLPQRNRQRPAGRGDHRPHHLDLPLRVRQVEVGDELEHAPPGLTDRTRDRDQLIDARVVGRGHFAGEGLVVERAGRAEAEGAGRDRLRGQPRHRLGLGRRGRLLRRRALAHRVHPQRGVRHLGGEIDVVRPPVERVQKLAERLPLPAQALVQGRAGNVLHTLHQVDQAVVVRRGDRGEAHPAVAHHDRGHPVPRGRLQPRLPGRLPVVVGVDVDEARSDHGAIGVDLLPAALADSPHLDDPVTAHRDIRRPRRGSRAVDHSAGSNHQVMHVIPSLEHGTQWTLTTAPGRPRAAARRRATTHAAAPGWRGWRTC